MDWHKQETKDICRVVRCLNYSSHIRIECRLENAILTRFIMVFLQENAGISKEEAAIASTLSIIPGYPIISY
jgi:hypothetical protein